MYRGRFIYGYPIFSPVYYFENIFNFQFPGWLSLVGGERGGGVTRGSSSSSAPMTLVFVLLGGSIERWAV